MYIEKEIPIYDFVCAISETVDLVSPVLNSHHKKTAYFSYRIAREMGLPDDEIQDIVLASMLHDIGAFSIGERKKALVFQSSEIEMKGHALLGYKLLKNFAPLEEPARMIKYHHASYNRLNSDIPLGSYIIHLADRTCVLFDEDREVLVQVPEALKKIFKKKDVFHPDAIAALERLSRLEYFWVEAFSPTFSDDKLQKLLSSKNIIGLETLRNFAKMIAQIIDFRSRFTATHSSGVAAVAMDLASISGFSEDECRLMEIAGYLHDLGKLAVPNNILEKKGKLNDEEFSAIKKHTYYTHAILSRINGLEDLASWAAHHHERHDGNGYPFHITGSNFTIPARVMAVADILTALTEDRPYRRGMEKEQAVGTLFNMAGNGVVDKCVVDLVNRNFLRVNDVRIRAQEKAGREYVNFHQANRQLYNTGAI